MGRTRTTRPKSKLLSTRNSRMHFIKTTIWKTLVSELFSLALTIAVLAGTRTAFKMEWHWSDHLASLIFFWHSRLMLSGQKYKHHWRKMKSLMTGQTLLIGKSNFWFMIFPLYICWRPTFRLKGRWNNVYLCSTYML